MTNLNDAMKLVGLEEPVTTKRGKQPKPQPEPPVMREPIDTSSFNPRDNGGRYGSWSNWELDQMDKKDPSGGLRYKAILADLEIDRRRKKLVEQTQEAREKAEILNEKRVMGSARTKPQKKPWYLRLI